MHPKDPEALRTNPDILVFEPVKPDLSDQENQMLQVTATPSGAWLAIWTTGTHENHPNQRVMYSRSEDRGKTWSEPKMFDGATPPNEDGTDMASWGWPFVVPETGRIYVFYIKNIGITDARQDTTGPLRYRVSDDDGLTWSDQYWDIPYEMMGHFTLDHPDPKQPRNWFGFQQKTILSDQTVLLPISRVSSYHISGTRNLLETDSEITFLRFDNILTESDPAKLRVTPFPMLKHGLRVPMPQKLHLSMAQEATVREFSDGRLICTMRTLTGKLYFALSSDKGQTWNQPRPLCYEPDGEPILNPLTPAPLFKLRDGRFLLKYYNNDGSAFGGTSPLDYRKNRRPAYITIGREIPGHPNHPIRFGPPKMLGDSEGVALGHYGRTSVATYGSLLEDDRDRVLFYPDRKRFLLGKFLTNDWLADCDPGE
jgi:hypothetical protein